MIRQERIERQCLELRRVRDALVADGDLELLASQSAFVVLVASTCVFQLP
jgi:hypothetical protein